MKLRNLIEEAMDILFTTRDKGHYHYAKVDLNGNGEITKTIGSPTHQHKVENWKTLESDEGHTHEIKRITRR